jgi:hypothetical protein
MLADEPPPASAGAAAAGAAAAWCVSARSSRGLYILNWIYRYATEKHYSQWKGEGATGWGGGRRAKDVCVGGGGGEGGDSNPACAPCHHSAL